MPPTINATLSRTSAVTAPPNMRVDSTKPPIGVSISTCPAVDSWTGTRSLFRARATTSTCANVRRSSSSGTNRNRPKPYGRSVPWNGSPSRRKRAEPRRPLRRPYPSQPTVRQGRQRSSPWPGDREFESTSLQRRVVANSTFGDGTHRGRSGLDDKSDLETMMPKVGPRVRIHFAPGGSPLRT